MISVNRECRIYTPCASCFAMRPQRCRVHIHSICHDFLRVPPLRRVTFSKRRKSNQKGLPYHSAASPRLGGSLTPALSWGHAATGHPWPIAAGAASCRATPHNSTCVRPSVMGIRVVWTWVWLQQKQKCIAVATEPCAKRFSAYIQTAEERSEAAMGCAAAPIRHSRITGGQVLPSHRLTSP